MKIILPDVAATIHFGRVAAHVLQRWKTPPPMLFYGDLGAGKTTLVSSLVRALPGGDKAETSSPSFTLCNMYPTNPPVAHFDLYRHENGSADESLLDFLDGQRHLVLVEWAERLPRFALPAERLLVRLALRGEMRTAELAAHGPQSEALLRALEAEAASAGYEPVN